MKIKTFTAAEICAIFREREIEPDGEFSAAAGRDWGLVEAWELPSGQYIVAYGNNATTEYDVASDIDDLAAWLESPDLNTLETLLQTANIRGIEEVEGAEEGSEGPFYVLMTRYTAAYEETCFVPDESGYEPLAFDTYADAEEWIAAAEDGVYCASHDEVERPSYTIVAE